MSVWYENAVFYHIYPLGLCGAPKINDGKEEENRLEKLNIWIPHIKSLGCTAIYIGPLFDSISHGYDTTDYKLVDRRLGDNQTFRTFVDTCHEAGIKVVVDGVFNHTGREFFAFRDLKEKREGSAYRDWYCNVNFYGNNEFNDGFSYDAWGGYNILAKLNQRNPQVKQYFFDVIKFWVSEFDIDGIRLDAADVLDFEFMKEMREIADSVKDEFWLMGEVIHGDYSRWANQNMLHSVTNYELHKGLYSGHNDHNYFEIAHTIRRLFDENGGICKDARLYNFVDNHDVDRLVNKLKIREHIYPIYMLLYTLPGIPSLYYGSEFALEGKKENGSDDAIRPELQLEDYYPLEGTAHEKLMTHLTKLGAIKQEYQELTYGRYKELTLTNRQYSFARILDNKAVITAVNNDENAAVLYIPLPIQADKAMDIFTGEEIPLQGNQIMINVEGNAGRMIHIFQ